MEAVQASQVNRKDDHSGYINPSGYLSVGNHSLISPEIEKIKFDVAVVATDKDGAVGGVSVLAGFLGAGVKGHHETTDMTTSRIQFEIPVLFPVHEMAKTENNIRVVCEVK